MPILAAASLLFCTVVDGDTLRCGEDRVRMRLLGIDAPELPGHCRKGRECAPGDPFASKAALERLVNGQRVRLQQFGHDRYRRPLVIAWVGDVNLSCAQIRGGQAVYKPGWDRGRRIKGCVRTNSLEAGAVR